MVARPNAAQPPSAVRSVSEPTERPFALRSTIYTIGFLIFILGVVPSIFHIAGEWALRLVFDAGGAFDARAAGFQPVSGAAGLQPAASPAPASPVLSDIRSFWSAFRILVGAGIFAIGLAAYSACSAWLIYYGRGPHVEFDPPKHFVATGPYRWVRNPVVITLLITVLGEALFLGSLGIFVLLAVGMPIAHMQVTRLEEPLLRTRFGESYTNYCARVSRWRPHPPAD